MSDQLMLDPSTLLGDEGFAWLRDEPDLSRFVIPRHFIDQLNDKVEYTKRDESLFGRLPEGDDRQSLTTLVQKMTSFDSAEDVQFSELPDDVRVVANNLRELGSTLAAEEWIYLSTHSWLGARTRQVFSVFERAGAASLRVGRGALERVVTRALKLPEDTPDVLTPKLLAKAGIRFVAVGGPVVAPLLVNPVTTGAFIVAGIGLAAGLYLLLSDGAPPRGSPPS